MQTHCRGERALPALLLGLAILAPGAGTGCGRSSGAGESDPPSARASVDGPRLLLPTDSPQLAAWQTTPAMAEGPVSVTLDGRLVWNEDATVRIFSPFAGRVDRVLADLGQRVRSQDTLGLISSPDFGQAQAEARRAATDLALAERTLTRQRDLQRHGIVAQKEVESAEADVTRTSTELQRTVSRLAAYGGDTSAVTQLFPLRTPLEGVVVDRSLTPGQEVRPDQMLANAPQLFAPLFVITDPARLWVLVDVPEQSVPYGKAGVPLRIHARAWPGEVFHGRITHLAGALDPATRTLKVRGTVENPDRRLKAEMLVSVEVEQAPVASVSVPSSAVLQEAASHIVFVEERRGQFARREVRVGPAHDGVVPILNGVKVGERVVVSSALLLEQLFHTAGRS